MTERQRAITNFISQYWARNWTSPTVREIAHAAGLSSPASAHKQLENMSRLGMLERKQLSANRVLYRVPPDEVDPHTLARERDLRELAELQRRRQTGDYVSADILRDDLKRFGWEIRVGVDGDGAGGQGFRWITARRLQEWMRSGNVYAQRSWRLFLEGKHGSGS